MALTECFASSTAATPTIYTGPEPTGLNDAAVTGAATLADLHDECGRHSCV